MAKMTKEQIGAIWKEYGVEFDPATLTPMARMAYDKLKQAREAEKAAREAFEKAFVPTLGAAEAGCEWRVQYNFGKLKVCGHVPTEGKSSGASRKAVSLAEWQKARGIA